jgi:hypothetical protein
MVGTHLGIIGHKTRALSGRAGGQCEAGTESRRLDQRRAPSSLPMWTPRPRDPLLSTVMLYPVQRRSRNAR